MSLGIAPTMPVVAPHRAGRALALTCTAVAVGVGVHLAAGGAVTVGGVGAAVPVLLGLVWALTGRERGWLPIAGAQLAGQQAVHAILDGGAHPVDGGLPADVVLYAHVAAAALLATWLRFGERRVWAAARRAARLVAACFQLFLDLLGYHAPAGPRPPRPRSTAVPAHARALLRHAVTRRGPPVHV